MIFHPASTAEDQCSVPVSTVTACHGTPNTPLPNGGGMGWVYWLIGSCVLASIIGGVIAYRCTRRAALAAQRDLPQAIPVSQVQYAPLPTYAPLAEPAPTAPYKKV